ncbi:hypothetical protein O0I10_008479 [Lichtheimia ornata]|uniref:Uncharacterized protein n=1 Tax=Lichtheimia ornata TaxID=688661 RepID=A0AAD7V0A2_9FUNG|nr:uncharacterized protein O0I10_008479 [Lichtheimia ornata]KAJ8655815.1 hypothetical protein O0I10_008479 [Lichtheimia ornata]
MQICCYFQLFVLLLCFMLYAFSYLMDFKIIHNIRKEAERVEDMQRRHHDLRPDGVGRYIHCIYAVGEFTLSPYQHEEKYRVLSKLEPAFDLSCNNSIISPALDFLFAISVIFVECLTIVYIHNNTRGDTQGQDETSQ